MQTIRAVHEPDGSTQQALLFHSQKSQKQADFTILTLKDGKSKQPHLDKQAHVDETHFCK